MKRFICAVLCLSMILTLIAGIASASSTSIVRAKSDYKVSGYKVTGYGYDAESKNGYFTHLKVYLYVTYTRGVGLSNEGKTYYKHDDDEKVTDTRWTAIKQHSVTVYGNNSRDD